MGPFSCQLLQHISMGTETVSTSTKDMIPALSFCFSLIGMPEEIICDSGIQFTSKEYEEFANKWTLTLTMSSLHYSRGHGLIKRKVKIIKKVFRRCKEDGYSYLIPLYQLRRNLLDSKRTSPGKLLYNSQLRTALLHHQPSTQQWSNYRTTPSHSRLQ